MVLKFIGCKNLNCRVLNIFLFICVIGLYFYIFRLFSYTYITLVFDDLRPTNERLFVYYKGLKIGRVFKICHTSDYQRTLMFVMLYPRDLNLPINTTAILKKDKKNGWLKKENDVIELTYPKKPDFSSITNSSVIEGKSTIDIASYLSNQDSDSLEQIKINLAESTKNLSDATGELTNIIASLNEILQENQKEIKTSFENVSELTENANNVVKKVDSSISSNKLDNTFSNLNDSVTNIKSATASVDDIMQSLAGSAQSLNESMPRVDSTLYETQGIVRNLNDITGGVAHTLRKPFGGLRLFFGRVISKKNDCD